MLQEMNLDDIKLSEISQSQKTKTAQFNFYALSKGITGSETERSMVVGKGCLGVESFSFVK
jgi:hypothetical protein